MRFGQVATAEEVVQAYNRAGSLKAAGVLLGLTHQRVWQVVKEHAPELMHKRGVRASYRK